MNELLFSCLLLIVLLTGFTTAYPQVIYVWTGVANGQTPTISGNWSSTYGTFCGSTPTTDIVQFRVADGILTGSVTFYDLITVNEIDIYGTVNSII